MTPKRDEPSWSIPYLRHKRLRSALATHYVDRHFQIEEALIDLMHLCKRENINFKYALLKAATFFDCEVKREE
jgi:hypothetical protein